MIAVRYGVHSRGKFHLTPGPPQDRMARSQDFDALCGATLEGRSPVKADLNQIENFGKHRLCERCIKTQ